MKFFFPEEVDEIILDNKVQHKGEDWEIDKNADEQTVRTTFNSARRIRNYGLIGISAGTVAGFVIGGLLWLFEFFIGYGNYPKLFFVPLLIFMSIGAFVTLIFLLASYSRLSKATGYLAKKK